MENYQNFAYYYDSLMNESFYEDYLAFILTKTDINHVLELGCGSGTIAIELAKQNKSILATDLSEDMLKVAKMKAKNQQVDINFKQMDMTNFDLNQSFDGILCLCDSLNYLVDKQAVLDTFKSVYIHLDNNGYFIFDVHSLYKIDTIFKDYKEEFEDDDDYYYWHVRKVNEGCIEHFVIIEDKLEDVRFEEKHLQKTYAIETYQSLLKKAGFDKINIYGEFEPYKIDSERVIFVVRK